MDDVRPMTEADLEAVNEIYNHYIATSQATFDLEPKTLAWRREWFGRYSVTGRHRVLVYPENDRVLGFAWSSPHRPKAGYDQTIETSLYIAPGAVGRGIGSRLYEALFDALRSEDVHRAVAGIALPNDASVRLHERCGFRRAGLYTEQGRKFGKYWDVAWYEKPLAP